MPLDQSTCDSAIARWKVEGVSCWLF